MCSRATAGRSSRGRERLAPLARYDRAPPALARLAPELGVSSPRRRAPASGDPRRRLPLDKPLVIGIVNGHAGIRSLTGALTTVERIPPT